MIRLIGVRRIVVLLILLALNGAVGWAIFGYIEPEHQKSERQKSRVEGEIRDMRNAIRNIKTEMELLEKNQARYEELQEEKGFFLTQDRFLLERFLEEYASLTRFADAPGWNVTPVEFVEEEKAAAIDKHLARREISIQMESFLDTDMYRYVDRLNKEFPGQTRIKSISLTRGQPLNNENLGKVSAGESIGFISGSIELQWHTLVDASQDAVEDTGRRRR